MLYGERETGREREKENGREKNREREGEIKTGKEGERVRERCRICPELFIFKRNDRCQGIF